MSNDAIDKASYLQKKAELDVLCQNKRWKDAHAVIKQISRKFREEEIKRLQREYSMPTKLPSETVSVARKEQAKSKPVTLSQSTEGTIHPIHFYSYNVIALIFYYYLLSQPSKIPPFFLLPI